MQNFLARFMQRPLGCIHHWVAYTIGLHCSARLHTPLGFRYPWVAVQGYRDPWVAYTLGFQIPLGCSARLHIPLGFRYPWVALQCKVADPLWFKWKVENTLGLQCKIADTFGFQIPLRFRYPCVSDTLGFYFRYPWVSDTLGFQIPLGFRYPWVSDSLGFQIPLGCSSRLQIQNVKNLTKDLKQEQKRIFLFNISSHCLLSILLFYFYI